MWRCALAAANPKTMFIWRAARSSPTRPWGSPTSCFCLHPLDERHSIICQAGWKQIFTVSRHPAFLPCAWFIRSCASVSRTQKIADFWNAIGMQNLITGVSLHTEWSELLQRKVLWDQVAWSQAGLQCQSFCIDYKNTLLTGLGETSFPFLNNCAIWRCLSCCSQYCDCVIFPNNLSRSSLYHTRTSLLQGQTLALKAVINKHCVPD